MKSKGFFSALEEIAFEHNLELEDVIKCVERAMVIGARKGRLPYEGDIKADYDLARRRIKFFDYYYIVEDDDPESDDEEERILKQGEIMLSSAQVRFPDQEVKIGDTIKEKVDLEAFNRSAAKQFKESLIEGIKTLEKDRLYDYFLNLKGEVVRGRVEAVGDDFVIFNLGRGVTSKVNEKYLIPNEDYLLNQEKKMIIKEVERGKKAIAVNVKVSLIDKEIVRQTFALHIPEVASGLVEIVGLERKAGIRSKVGVRTADPEIDALGACVGPGGMRIREINSDLNGERVDIFEWSDDPYELVAASLSPAQVIQVIFPDEHKRECYAIVSDDQYSLAIGAAGINVKLAVGATGYNIDIKSLNEAQEIGVI